MIRLPEGFSPKLAAIDLDGTLLRGRVIVEVAREFHLADEVARAMNSRLAPYRRSQRIAWLLRDVSTSDITRIVEGMPLSDGAAASVQWLKDSGIKVGIISDGYTLATKLVARKLRLDYDVANVLHQRNGILTGAITMPMGWERIGCKCQQSVCKRYALTRLAKRFGADLSETVAIGDSAADLCMLTSAGLGIWYSRDKMPAEILVGKGVVRIKNLRRLSSVMNATRAARAATPFRSGPMPGTTHP